MIGVVGGGHVDVGVVEVVVGEVPVGFIEADTVGQDLYGELVLDSHTFPSDIYTVYQTKPKKKESIPVSSDYSNYPHRAYNT